MKEKQGVHIMSIHKSKGLEFPFVFLPDLNKTFNFDDAGFPVVIHDKMGIGLKLRVRKTRAEYRTQMHRGRFRCDKKGACIRGDEEALCSDDKSQGKAGHGCLFAKCRQDNKGYQGRYRSCGYYAHVAGRQKQRGRVADSCIQRKNRAAVLQFRSPLMRP